MANIKFLNGRKKYLISAVGGAVLNLCLTVLLSIVSAWVLSNELMKIEKTRYLITGIIIVSAFLSCWIVSKRSKQVFKTAAITALVYLVLLSVTNIIFFANGFEGVVMTAILVIGSYFSAALIAIKRTKKSNRFVKLYKKQLVGKQNLPTR